MPTAYYYNQLERNAQRNYRRDTPMTTADFKNHVKTAPKKAHDILTSYQNGARATFNDPMIPDQGKLFKSGQLQSDAVAQLNDLNEKAGASADLARKAMIHERDSKRPKISADEYRKHAERFRYLQGRGISLEKMADQFADDPAALAVLQDEVGTLAWGERPDDPSAGEGLQAKLEQAAYETFSDDYRSAADQIADFDKGSYRVQVAINQALRVAREGDLRADASLPAFEADQMIEA